MKHAIFCKSIFTFYETSASVRFSRIESKNCENRFLSALTADSRDVDIDRKFCMYPMMIYSYG